MTVFLPSTRNEAKYLSARRDGDWRSGRFHHLKEVCWRDPTDMFQRYKQLTHGPDSPVQEPKFLAPFYSPLEGMRDFFIKVCCPFTVFLKDFSFFKLSMTAHVKSVHVKSLS